MKSKGFILVSCLAAGALVASPAIGKPTKKSSISKSNRTAPQTTRVTRNYNQNINSRVGSNRYYSGTRYSGTRSYANRQYSGTRYYGRTGYYGDNYGGGTRVYYGGGGYPYSGYNSGWGYGTSGYYPYSYYGGYPGGYSYYGGYPYSGYNNYYSYYTPTYGYNASMVAAVQRRLGQLGYYHGVVDGVIGPQTRGAIAAFESRNGMAVDGMIDRPLLNSLGLG
jgi:hypothetical protein